jgi:hypothetical protein
MFFVMRVEGNHPCPPGAAPPPNSNFTLWDGTDVVVQLMQQHLPTGEWQEDWLVNFNKNGALWITTMVNVIDRITYIPQVGFANNLPAVPAWAKTTETLLYVGAVK